MCCAKGCPRSVSARNRSSTFATRREEGSPQPFIAKIIQGSRDLSWFNPPAYPRVPRNGRARRARPVMPASTGLGSRRLAGFRRRLAGFRRRLSRGAWLSPGLCRGLSRFGGGLNHRWRLQLGLLCSAMMAMVQRLDTRGFCFHPELSVAVFSALVFQVCRNRFRCHSPSVAEPATSKLSNLALCQRSAIRGLVEVRCWQSSAAKNTLDSNGWLLKTK